ncbi:MAG: hypothetical protein ACR2LN_05095 [Candidatus Levyibacteriota bacterium]
MYNELVLTILSIIEYKDDKEAFVADFNRIINSQGLVALLQQLPVEKREEADNLIASSDSSEKFTQNVHQYFTDEQVQKELDTAAAQAISQWIGSIASSLNNGQREKLVALSEKLQKAIEASVV